MTFNKAVREAIAYGILNDDEYLAILNYALDVCVDYGVDDYSFQDRFDILYNRVFDTIAKLSPQKREALAIELDVEFYDWAYVRRQSPIYCY